MACRLRNIVCSDGAFPRSSKSARSRVSARLSDRFLSGLDTRLTVPLFPLRDYPNPAARLNPVFNVEDADVVMMTQYAAAIEKRRLLPPVAWLADEQDIIMNAIDMLLTGY